MLTRRIRFITLSFVVLSIACSFLQRSVDAQDLTPQEPGVFRSDKLEMIVKAGYGKLEVNSWLGSWTPFRISIANQGEPIAGKLVVLAKGSSNQNLQGREFVKEIQLPTGSRQYHEISAFLNSGEDIEVSIVSNDKTVATTTVKIDRQFGNDNQIEVAVIDNDSTALNNITNMLIPRTSSRLPFQKVTSENSPKPQEQTADQTQQQNPQPNPNQQQNRRNQRRMPPGQQDPEVHPLVISPEDMPRDFVSYDPVDVVVINDAPLSQLNEDQARALKMWVASGGLLIVTGGADIVGLHLTGLAAILPVEVQGSSTVASLTELTDIYGAFDNPASLLAMAARAKPNARVIIGSAEKAIVAENNYGSGLVRFVAYNPKLNPYRSWNSARNLWTDLLLPVVDLRSTQYWASRIRKPSATVSWNSQNFLFKLADIKPTSSNYFLFFLLFYVIAVGPVNYFALKWMKKLDLAWVTIPAVVLLFTTASIIIAQTRRGGTVSSDMSFVELHQTAGLKETLTGLLIRPESKGIEEVNIEGRDTYAAESTQGAQGLTTGNWEATRQAGNYLLRVPTANMAAVVLQIRSISESKSPLVTMREEGNATVRIKNLSESPINYAVYLSPAGMSDAFTIAAGEEKQIALNSPKANRFRDWYYNQLPADSDEADSLDGLWGAMTKGAAKNNTKLQGFFNDELMNPTYKDVEHPILLGFVDKYANTIEIDSIAKRRSKSFYLINP
jgi:hypothetical protein